MTFWILLAIMSLVAVGFAVWPLFKHQGTLTPLIAGSVIFVVALSTGLYYRQGNPDLPSASGSSAPSMANNDLGDVNSAIEALAARLAENPNDVEGWKMLARSYMQTGNYTAAADAFERVLALDPDDPESLFYGGLAAGERGDTELAASRWERLLASDPPPDIQATLERGIAQWRGEELPADHPPVAAAEPAADESAAAEPAEQQAPVEAAPVSDGAVVRANLSLSDAAAAAINVDATIFIIARDVNVPVPPIAVSRLRVSDLPAAVELGDQQSMVQGRNLSGFPEFELVARVSMSGQPSQQPGDWYGTAIVKPAENNDIQISIDQLVE